MLSFPENKKRSIFLEYNRGVQEYKELQEYINNERPQLPALPLKKDGSQHIRKPEGKPFTLQQHGKRKNSSMINCCFFMSPIIVFKNSGILTSLFPFCIKTEILHITNKNKLTVFSEVIRSERWVEWHLRRHCI